MGPLHFTSHGRSLQGECQVRRFTRPLPTKELKPWNTLDCRLINNQREKYNFVFNGVLTEESKQEEVFERVCNPAVKEFMAGFNATVFAYGQTGSGKTFTITGGPERYAGAT